MRNSQYEANELQGKQMLQTLKQVSMSASEVASLVDGPENLTSTRSSEKKEND
jgi:hypothetical protein